LQSLYRLSAAAVGDDEVGEDPGGEAARQQDQAELAVAERRMPCQISPMT
jgi:hypothetical protein